MKIAQTDIATRKETLKCHTESLSSSTRNLKDFPTCRTAATAHVERAAMEACWGASSSDIQILCPLCET